MLYTPEKAEEALKAGLEEELESQGYSGQNSLSTASLEEQFMAIIKNQNEKKTGR